ncbi:hypothetical protein [Plasticicumulans sp.]|uniref:hypothetical protein n=1 Tax=Plasticicumulans sp. TaxID=2307179 RepID=UPI00393CFD1C
MARLRITNYVRCLVTDDMDILEVNRVWKLFVAITQVPDALVVEALTAHGVAITKNRVKAWRVGTHSENYSPLNLAELERAMEAVLMFMRPRGIANLVADTIKAAYEDTRSDLNR